MSGVPGRSWALRRLVAMGPTEIGLRAARGIRNRLARPGRPSSQRSLARLEDVSVRPPDGQTCDEWALDCLRRGRFSLLVGAADREALSRALSDAGAGLGGVLNRADAILEGRLPAFGCSEVDVGEDPDWHRDPASGLRWPLAYWADTDFRAPGGLDDPRYVWEVNRHHHLVTLGRAYALSGDDRYASAVWRQIRSWITENPPSYGINWASPLEMGIRLISWALALDLTGAGGATSSDLSDVLVSAALQAHHISDNLSVYASSRNNHLIGEAAGLLVVGAKFPQLEGAGRWAALGRSIVEREVAAQVTEEGIDREQAFHYGTFVLEFSLMAAAACRALGVEPGRRLLDRVSNMSGFLSAVAGPTGELPAVGDGDGGRAYELSEAGLGRQGTRAAVCGAIATGGRLPAAARHEDLAPALWLFGSGPAEEALKLPRGDREQSGTARYASGGCFVAGRGRHHGVIDCGPLGYLSIAAHGHADCLSLCVSNASSWLVVDPGTYCYHRQRTWRDHFRSTAAHNTVTIDGASQSEMLGPFLWGRKARPRAICWSTSDHFDYFEGEHDGYVKSFGVGHRRVVVFGAAGYWAVVDFLSGRDRHGVRAAFQLAPGLVRNEGTGLLFSGDAGSVELVSLLPDGLSVSCREGCETPPEGWVSRCFGRRERAPAVVVEGSCPLPTVLGFVIVPDGEARDIDVRWSAEPSPGAVALEVRHGEGTDRLLFGGSGHTVGSGFTGRFGFVAVREDAGRALGIDVLNWSEEGSDVRFEAVRNLLSNGPHGRERDH